MGSHRGESGVREGRDGVPAIVALLEQSGATALGEGLDVSLLDHALQTAAILRRMYPDDLELAVAGLVHDIGHVVDGSTDETHAPFGAKAVAPVLGERVATLVGLHVEAKRYLVATDGRYGAVLAADSVASLEHQGGAMSPSECDDFLRRPLAAEAIALRRADEEAKVPGATVEGLDAWVPRLEQVASSPL